MLISLLIIWEIITLFASGIMCLFVSALASPFGNPTIKEYLLVTGLAHLFLWGVLGMIMFCYWVIGLNL